MDPHGPIARRFPLVARFRPACLPLPARVRALVELADRAAKQGEQGLASAVFNQAALVASDLDLPDLARLMCHRHAEAYLRACPLPAMSAIRGLEPLVNLARLQIRAGHTDDGRQRLLGLYEAVGAGRSAAFEGITVPANLTCAPEDRREVHAWLWRVVLADGTRTLTATGRWPEALAHIEQHRGVGTRMLEGRQVAVVAALTVGDTERAAGLLADTAPGEPWEDAVTACLALLCRPLDHRPTDREIDDAVASCHQLDYQGNLVVFQARLVLSIVDAAGRRGHSGVQNEVAELADRILDLGDGYAAREVFAHDECVALLSEQQVKGLAQTVNSCALGQGTIPSGLRTDLLAALSTSEEVILRTLIAQSAARIDI